MKLIRKILLVVGIIILSCVFITSCALRIKNDYSDITGTYYLYEEDQLDKDSYFIITSSSWTDENNDSGPYKLNGTTIIFYMSESGNEELYRGTIGNGKLEIAFEGIKTTYYKEGSEPSDDDVYYTVTFKDYDGTVLQTSSVKKGETPAYNKSNPSRENDDNYSYTFSGWQPTLTEVSEDAIYTATYTSQLLLYYVTIDLDGGTSSATKLQFKTDKISKDMLPFDVKKSGFVFKGYSLNDVKVYDENGNDVSNYQPSANMTFKALWTADTNTTYKVEHYLQNIDNDNYTLYETDNITVTTNTQPADSFKTYEGFASPSITQVNIDENGNIVIKLYYTRNSYKVTLNKDIDKAGTITGAGTYKYGEEVTIKAETNEGYTFIGWYDGDNELTKELSYTFTMTATNLVYTAKWTANTNTPYKVEHYLQNIDNIYYPSTPYETDNLTGTTDTQTAGSVKTYEGFTSPSITQVIINGNGNTVIKLYYTRNSYKVTLNKDIDKAGTITGAGTYKYGEEVTITAVTTNEGYTFNGWYKNDKLYTDDSSFDWTIGSEEIVFEARYTVNKYTIILDNQVAGVKISGISSENEYEYDSQITLTATNIPSGCTIHWTSSGDVVKVGDTYTFNVPADNITITITTVPYTREGNKIYFGTYPQTKVTATAENGLLSITFDSSTWTSYRYYISKSQFDFMYYKDVDIDNNGTYDYRGVYFTQYRPDRCSRVSSTDYTYQDDNGYSTNTIYWFSYEPIEWNIITESSVKALIIANLILDSQDYYPSTSSSSFSHNGGDGYINNYELSAIREFLNDDFYNTAFNELQKALIETTIVDNSAASTGTWSSSYACNNTNDKMFLLSEIEAFTYYTRKTDRQAEGSDYAKCQGLSVYSSNGNSNWWLRSPHYKYPNYASYVGGDGDLYSERVGDTVLGVRPACWITL